MSSCHYHVLPETRLGTFAGQSTNGTKMQPHVIIVLTHTDLIDIERREHVIDEYKKEILKHVKWKYTCKYVHHKIFPISNKERDDPMIRSLQKTIVELCVSRPTYGDKRPCTWLKLEADIQKYCAEVGKRFLQLKTLQQYANRTFGMSFDELKSFLQFHHLHRNLIFTDNRS